MIEFHNTDCMEFMANIPDKYYDLAVVAPPYGLDKKLSSGGGKMRNSPFKKLYRDSNQWDKLPETEYWVELFRVSTNQIVFGANYFLDYLPNTRGFICWDKKQDMPTLSACELVWTSFDKTAKIYKKVSTDLNRFHPTQKPIGLYDFCFKYAKLKPNDKIIDTHGGSMSSAISVYKANTLDKMNLSMDIIELDKEYFDKAVQRFNNYTSQETLNFPE